MEVLDKLGNEFELDDTFKDYYSLSSKEKNKQDEIVYVSLRFVISGSFAWFVIFMWMLMYTRNGYKQWRDVY